MSKYYLKKGRKSYIGVKFNMLTIISEASDRHRRMVVCKCDCGEQKTIVLSKVINSEQKSCGCLSKNRFKTHGLSDTPEYRSWKDMKRRCLSPHSKGYKNYGGRGISICERWLNSFENFITDMGMMPSSKHQLDRIENNGNYEPNNCKWSTKKEQMSNTRRNFRIAHGNKDMIISDWARELKVYPTRSSVLKALAKLPLSL